MRASGLLLCVAVAAVVQAVIAVEAQGPRPLYGSMGRVTPGVSQLEGLPLYAPSTMPTRFYDSTEYDVSPLQLPLDLPAPPPPPSFLQTNAAANAQANARAQAVRAAQQAQAQAQMRARAQAQAQAQAQSQRMARPPIYNPIERLRVAANAMSRAIPASAPKPVQPMMLQQRSRVRAQTHASHRQHNRRHTAAAAATQQQQQNARQNNFEAYAERMRFLRSPRASAPAPTAVAPSMMEMSSHSQVHAGMQQRVAQESIARMRSNAVAWQQQRAAQTAYLNAEHADQRTAAMASRPQQPFLADTPESIAARGFVPHFAPLVRAIPTDAPVQPYAGFFEASARVQASQQQQQQQQNRPQEPFLPRLPPPPIVLGRY